jgi:uncharacterized protein (TIGR01319 family)
MGASRKRLMIVSIDIGSTWTKGARFELRDGELVLRERATHPTTVANLEEGFSRVLQKLTAEANECPGEPQLFYSSSAKGGLAVAALGLVPDITLDTAKMAAASAGAKLAKVFSYRLTRADIRDLEVDPPDILLFAGGTDGGNTDYVLSNAQTLAESALDCAMIYAGNRSVRDDVAELLESRDLTVVDNLLPRLDSPNPEPTREAIRDIFLEKIVKGKGLDTIIEKTGVQPLPTPYAVYEFTQHIRHQVPGWEEFILLDLGGATTDVYSAHREQAAPDTVLRGMPEAECKRTVEGDLGLRVSARSAAHTGQDVLNEALQHHRDAFNGFLDKLAAQADFIPDDRQGRDFDRLLAGACLAHACARHAGRKQPVWTAEGMVNVQLGRDLTGIRRIIGSGGYLSRTDDFDPRPWLTARRLDEQGRQILLPASFDYHRDQHYLFPLLANVAQGFPGPAARAGIRCLTAAAHFPKQQPEQHTEGVS